MPEPRALDIRRANENGVESPSTIVDGGLAARRRYAPTELSKFAVLGLPLLAALGWGGSFPIGKAVLPNVNVFYLSSVRYTLAALIFTAILLNVEGCQSLRFDGHFVRIVVLGAVGFGGLGLLVFLGLAHTQPQNAALIVATMPLLTALVRWGRDGYRPTRVTIAFVLAAFVGVGLVATRGNLSVVIHGQVGGWDLVVLLGVLCWVNYTLGAASVPDWSPLRFTALTALTGSAAIIVITVLPTLVGFAAVPSLHQTAGAWPELAYLVLPGTVIAVLAWNAGIERLGAQQVILFINLVPAVTLVIEIARGYQVGHVEVAGLTVTLLAVLGNNLWQRWTASRTGRAESVLEGAAA